MFNLQVKLLYMIDNVWAKRSTKAKQLVLKMLAKRP